jgi:hypothetical protein
LDRGNHRFVELGPFSKRASDRNALEAGTRALPGTVCTSVPLLRAEKLKVDQNYHHRAKELDSGFGGDSSDGSEAELTPTGRRAGPWGRL